MARYCGSQTLTRVRLVLLLVSHCRLVVAFIKYIKANVVPWIQKSNLTLFLRQLVDDIHVCIL